MKARSIAQRPQKAQPRRMAGKAFQPARSSHERQAEESAARFVLGEKHLSRHLTPAPASAMHAPFSPGQSLPRNLRDTLEQSFDADLGGLRLHTDPVAGFLAQAVGARAFTAGASIYFGPGAWAPDSEEGKSLVAHEVAHALQQTGRATHGRRIRLEPGASGGHGVQRAPDPDKARAARYQTFALSNVFKAINMWQPSKDAAPCVEAIGRHLDALADDALVQKYGEQLKRAVDGESLEDATSAVDDALAKVPADDKTSTVKALFFDAYKALNADRKAKDVVGKDFPEKTAFGSWSFYESQRRRDAAWVSPLLKSHPVGRQYFLNAIVAVARIDFYGPTRGALDLDMSGKFNEKMIAAISEAIAFNPFMPDERTAAALAALMIFNRVRLAPFAELAAKNKSAKTLTAKYVHKLNFINQYTDPAFLPNLALDNTGDPEVLAIATEAGLAIAPIAKRAVEFWQRVDDLVKKALSPDRDTGYADKLKDLIRSRIPALKSLAGTEKRLTAIFAQAARLSGGHVPSPAELAADFSIAAASVQQLIYQIDGALAAREKTLRSTVLPDADKVADDAPLSADTLSDEMIYGFVLQLLFMLHDMLKAYVAPPRRKEEGERIQDQDAAVAELQKVAKLFRGAGYILGYEKLREAADAVAFARQGELKKSYVGLLAPFDEVPATLQEFQHDFPKDLVSKGALSGASLIQAVFAIYYTNLLGKLNDALNEAMPSGSTHEFDYNLDNKPIVNTALDAVKTSFHLPRKYRVPKDSTILYVRPQDMDSVFEQVAEQHPVILALIKDHQDKNERGYVPMSIDAHSDGFVAWIVPDLDFLVDKLKNIPGIDQLTVDGKLKLGLPGERLTPMEWLDALSKAAANDEKVKNDIRDGIDAWLKKSLADLDAPLRRATINERYKVRPLIEEQWEKLTKRFLDAPNSYYEAPKAALRYMLTFAGNIQPANLPEQKLQMTGLLLEIAPVLSRKLGQSTAFGDMVNIAGTDRLDIVLPLHAHVAGAAKFAQDPQNLAGLKTLRLAFPESDLARRAALLQGLAQEFQKTAEQAQETRELMGIAADRMLRMPDRSHPVVAKAGKDDADSEDIFMVNGIVYQLIEVHRDFRYEPELMSMASGVKWGGDDIANRRLWIDGHADVLPIDAAPIPLVTILRTAEGMQPEKLVVTSNNTAMLSELTYALSLHITIKDLETLASVLDAYAQVIMTVLQAVFPEFATEIGAAEIAGSIVQFLGSAEFAMLKGALDTDAGGLFEQGLSKITSQLSPDALWDYLLFDVKPPVFQTLSEALELFGRMGVFQRQDSDKTKGSVRAVFGRLIKVAAEIIHGFIGLEEHVSFPFRKLSLFVEGSPWLSLILRFVANNLYRLEGTSLADLGVEQAADFISEIQQMYLRFETVVAGLGEYELPQELVPIPVILDLLVNLLFDHLPLKYRKAAQITKRSLQPLFDYLYKQAEIALKKHDLDPNRIWRDYAAKRINPYIQKAGKEVSEEVQGVLKRVPFLHELATIKVPDVAAQFVDREVTPAPKLEAGLAAPRTAPLLAHGPGAALGAGDRAQAQSGFGHDFSHVRMHSGDAVDASLRSAGAHAATHGSHIYLDSGISTGTPGGRDILNHELAHVLQQAGPRPLGQRHSAVPARGSRTGSGSGSGWDLNPGAERQADGLAHAARNPAQHPRAVTPAHGLQPSLADIATKFFVALGDASKLHESAVEMTKTAVKEKELGQAAPGLKEAFVDKFTEALKKTGEGSAVGYSAPFDAAGEDLRQYLLDNRLKDVTQGLPHVLNAGLHKIEPKGKDAFWILIPGRVETALEEFFFGMTGLSVDIEFNLKTAIGPDGKERKSVDLDKPFRKIRFNHIHLPMIGGRADIWKNVMEASFPSVGEKTPIYQAKARLVLQGLQPRPGLFAAGKNKAGKSTIAFSKKTRQLIEDAVKPPPGGDVPGDLVPTWADYIKPDTQAKPGGKHGQIGLRLGFYGERNLPDKQFGTDRQSHHTVQYLLIEYLVNSKDNVQPFPHPLSLYPNIRHATEKRVDVIAKTPTANSGINISVHDDGSRGTKMPTILLSAHTHSKGSVHISPKPDDTPGSSATQGTAIHGEFKKYLGDYKDLVTGKNSERQLQAMADKAANKPNFKAADLPRIGDREATQEEMSTAIFNAACKTYTWMRDHMNAKLHKALDEQETFYYTSIVERATQPGIYKDGEAQSDYKPESIGDKIKAEVLTRQKKTLESSEFGFEEMSP